MTPMRDFLSQIYIKIYLKFQFIYNTITIP